MTHEFYDDIPNANATPEMHYKYAHRYDNLNDNIPENTGIKIIKNNFNQNDLNKKMKQNLREYISFVSIVILN